MAAESTPLPFPGTITGNVSVVSSYNLRGITIGPENDNTALQGGLDYSHDSGFYAGYWFSNLGYSYAGLNPGCKGTDCTTKSFENDFYAGFKGKLTEDVGFQLGGTVYYYYPGWNEGRAALAFQVNAKAWDALPESYKMAIQAATAEANTWMQAKYDALNPNALRRLVQGGAILRAYPQSVMDACFKATQETYAEESAKNPQFKKIFEDYRAFRNMEAQWFGVAEQAFAQYSFNKKL